MAENLSKKTDEKWYVISGCYGDAVTRHPYFQIVWSGPKREALQVADSLREKTIRQKDRDYKFVEAISADELKSYPKEWLEIVY